MDLFMVFMVGISAAIGLIIFVLWFAGIGEEGEETVLGNLLPSDYNFDYGATPMNNQGADYKGMVVFRAASLLDGNSLPYIEIIKSICEDLLNSNTEAHGFYIFDIMAEVNNQAFPGRKSL